MVGYREKSSYPDYGDVFYRHGVLFHVSNATITQHSEIQRFISLA